MKILVLKPVREIAINSGTWEYTLEYKEGLDIFDGDNYVRQLVDDYPVDFDYKGIDFNEEFIVEALTYYFDRQYSNKEIISYDDLTIMFADHMDLKDADTVTKIKRICVEHAIQELKGIEFE